MTHAKLGTLLGQLRRLVGPPPTTESDHSLLARFLAGRDEAAFAALLGRHGPMVFGVCRRLLGRVQDAEDVVQAVFLLLARKASTIRKRASLGCWLYGVAQRLSLGLKRQEMNRLRREKQASLMRGHTQSQGLDCHEIQEMLDTALEPIRITHEAIQLLGAAAIDWRTAA
jgi:DNA-directed RNA polymerase specialized sigma24 family protein